MNRQQAEKVADAIRYVLSVQGSERYETKAYDLLVDALVGDVEAPAPVTPRTMERAELVISRTAAAFGLRVAEIMDMSSHLRTTVRARHFAMLLLRESGFSYPEVGRAFNSDHTTAMHGIRQASNRLASDPRLREIVEGLRNA